MTRDSAPASPPWFTFWCLRRTETGEYVLAPYLQLYDTMSVLHRPRTHTPAGPAPADA